MTQEIIDLYDAYTHTPLDRRVFLARLARLTGSMAAALAILPALEADRALAAIVPPDDGRLESGRTTYPGAAGEVTAYMARPRDAAKRPAVIVIHENRGLNAHIEDVTRRVALEGFLALAPDLLSPWGGGMAGELAVHEPDLDAAVAYYGRQPKAADVARIKAPLLLHYAELDARINEGIPAFEEALKKAGRTYTLHLYEGAQHAFHNDTSEARYNKEATVLSWSRTVAFLKEHLQPERPRPSP